MKKNVAVYGTLLVMLLAGDASAQSARFDGPARRHDYVRALIGPSALIGIGVATGIDELRDDPPTWDTTDRLVSNAGRSAVQASIHHGIAALMDRSTWYYKCECDGLGSRVGHAIAESITDHDRNGGTHFSIGRVAGAYGAAFAESTWRPDRRTEDVLLVGTSSIVGSALWNIVREVF